MESVIYFASGMVIEGVVKMFDEEQVDDGWAFRGKKENKANQRRSQRNLKRVEDVQNSMFDWRSRHLILVLTLSYKPEYSAGVTLECLRKDRDRFLNNFRSNETLRGINAYVWKIEEGDAGGGLHLHLLIFYSGDCRADVYIARLIGEYWENVVTRGRGAYWNSNARKEYYAGLPWGNATGQVDRNDLEKRESLSRVMGYLAKSDQMVGSRDNPHCRLFGTSQLPV
ncbi:inovirus-type Gp2 protein [Solimonas marina]|uniref:Inovirus-type Gp2 protein n=1 Tax=Solimonas marina TaxID=2714601 RepID=A0A969WE95_9GAMM|nr:inovirus-type Gp2 protein [Solimonas marina]NKF24505.1 inovirus-type Gp2 protein [Solimonas marina]